MGKISHFKYMIINNKLIKIISCVNATDEIMMSEINVEYDTLNHNVCVFFSSHRPKIHVWYSLVMWQKNWYSVCCGLVFLVLKWEVIVCFVDIGRIVDHLCFIFVFSLYGIKWVHYFWKRHFPLQIISAIRAILSANTA